MDKKKKKDGAIEKGGRKVRRVLVIALVIVLLVAALTAVFAAIDGFEFGPTEPDIKENIYDGPGGSATPAPSSPTCSHSWTTRTTSATCTSGGSTVKSCSKCGSSSTVSTTAALGHAFVGGSCTTPSRCSRCGATGALGGHNMVASSTPATCSSAGWSGSTCSICGHSTGSSIPALGHNIVAGPYVAPTCTTAGFSTSRCSRCGAGATVPIAALGHKEGNPIYTSLGYTEHSVVTQCTRCSNEMSSNTEAHSDDDSNNYCDECNQLLMFPTHWDASTNGGTVDGKTVVDNGTIPNEVGTPPTAVPVKTGYTFTGWYTQQTGGVLYSGTTVSEETTYYAQFEANHYTIKYHGNGATSGSIADSSCTYDTNVVLTSNVFARSHTLQLVYNYAGCQTVDPKVQTLTFLGWSTDPNADSAEFTNGQTVKNLTADADGVIDLYAVWSKVSVSLPVDGSPAGWVARIGYDLRGWSESSSASAATYTTEVSVNRDITLYAVYGPNKSNCKITLDPVGGTVTYPENVTMNVWAESGIMKDTVKDGHKEDYATITYQWQESSDGGSTWSNISGATAPSYTTPEGKHVGTYQYRCVATAVFDGKPTSDTSAVATIVIEKADGVLEVTSPTGTVIRDGDVVIYKVGIGEQLYVYVVSNPDSVISITHDSNNVIARLSGSQVMLDPVGNTKNVGVRITIRVTNNANSNYNDTQMVVWAYASTGPEFTNPVTGTIGNPKLTPGSATNTDVVATFRIHDYMHEVDSSYNVVSVRAYRITDSGVEIEMPVTGEGNELYSMTIKENGKYVMEATDTLGNTTRSLPFVIDFIDKEPPVIDGPGLGVAGIEYNTGAGTIDVIILAVDNVTPISDLEYCWNYVEGSPSNIWSKHDNMRDFVAGTVLNIAVRDEVGNITQKQYKVTLKVLDGDDGGGGGTAKVLTAVYDDLSGTVFGPSAYLQQGDVKAYPVDGMRFRIKITPVSGGGYIGGYLELNGATFPVQWFEDENCTVSIGTTSSDGRINLVNTEAYGLVIIDPAEVVAGGTNRAASAELYLTQYTDTAMSGKVSSECYAMPCAVDKTPPAIQATYDAYTHQVKLVVKDAIAGISDLIDYSVGGENGECQPSAVLTYPVDPADGTAFTITFTAVDRVGNSATKSFTFTPYADNAGNADGEGEPDDGNSNGNGNQKVYGYKSRMFTIYIINGVRSNTTIDMIGK